MAEFLVELYAPSSELAAAEGWTHAAQDAALALRREGTPVHCVRSIVVPEDETCFLLYEAPSLDAVRQAARRAGLAAARITESIDPAKGTGR